VCCGVRHTELLQLFVLFDVANAERDNEPRWLTANLAVVCGVTGLVRIGTHATGATIYDLDVWSGGLLRVQGHAELLM
jgi:hypothetical protein